jgi:hypothetical protein
LLPGECASVPVGEEEPLFMMAKLLSSGESARTKNNNITLILYVQGQLKAKKCKGPTAARVKDGFKCNKEFAWFKEAELVVQHCLLKQYAS